MAEGVIGQPRTLLPAKRFSYNVRAPLAAALRHEMAAL